MASVSVKGRKAVNKTRKVILLSLVALIALIVAFSAYYLSTYYKASDGAVKYLKDSSTYKVVLKNNMVVFTPIGDTRSTGFIIYPGGKVDYKAYAPLAAQIAEKGYLTAIVKMPFNLAVFKPKAASEVIAGYPDIKKWVVGGHSLGGVMASSFAAGNVNIVKGVVFLASYPLKDISSANLKILTIIGSNDGMVSPVKYNVTRKLLPADTQFIVINGGNHCGFGSYGFQKGDKKSTIRAEDQQKQTVEAITSFLGKYIN